MPSKGPFVLLDHDTNALTLQDLEASDVAASCHSTNDRAILESK